MTEKEKQILEALDTKTLDVTVPEGLAPEEIEKKLKTTRKKGWKRSYTYFAAAACLAVIVGCVALWQNFSSSDLKGTDGEQEEGETQTLTNAEEYKDIYQYFKSAQSGGLGKTNEMAKGSADDRAVMESKSDTASSSANAGAAHSDTNVRTEGVGEADIVKTDGTHLFTLKESTAEIAIVDTTGDQMEAVSYVKPDNGVQIAEFYVDGTTLFVLGNVQATRGDGKTATIYYENNMVLLTYDLTDITAPKLTGTMKQSGYYETSRYTDGYLYLFSTFYTRDNLKKDDISTYIPSVNGKAVPAADIILPPDKTAYQYTVITSVKADNPKEAVCQKAVLSTNGQCYVSTDNIYIYENIWRGSRDNDMFNAATNTCVRKISYKDGELAGEAQGQVKGYLNDSFCIDEYNGYLRLVTSIDSATETSNAVYVLDENLKTVGKITDLAKGEVIYSARLMGDTGYFVTYKQVDPLFSVDFSDPENPEITGALKIPGFSEYLHLYDEGLLLGIGMDTEEESGTTNGVKLSMFDISDPTDVKEVHKYTIEGAYSSDVFYDYRAVLIDKDKNMIGFSTYGNSEMYHIFSYDKTNGFRAEMEEEVNGISYMGTRGIYIQDKLYVVKGNAIESYQIGDYKKLDDILL